MNRLRLAVGIVAALVATTLVVVVLLPGDDTRDGGEAARPSTTTTAAPEPIGVTVTGVEANGLPAPSDAVVAEIKRVVDTYVAVGVVTPLRTGAPAGDLAGALSADAISSLGDPAVRATVLDEGLPAATKSVTARAASMALSTVAAHDGSTAVVGARLTLELVAVGEATTIAIARTGDLVFAPGPEPGSWRIDSFSLRTERNSEP